MSTQTILWTALPNGWSDAVPHALRLTVFVAPRLSTATSQDATLADFPDFVNWPKTVSAINFAVVFQGGATVAATPDPAVLEAPLWEALFKPATLVRSHIFDDFTDRGIRSYPAKFIFSELKQIYRNVVLRAAAELPKLTDLNLGRQQSKLAFADLRSLAFNADMDAGYETGISQLLHGERHAVSIKDLEQLQPQDQRAAGFYQLRKFHEFNRQGAVHPKPLQAPRLDFHEVLSGLARYQSLLRALGLAFDVTVPLPAGLSALGEVRVFPRNVQLQTPTQSASPRTQYQLDEAQALFVAAAKPGSEIDSGLLQPASNEYEVIQVDIDGAALKATGFATNIMLQTAVTIDTPDDAGLPALRTAGFSVAQTDRAVKLAQTLKAAKSFDGSLQGDPSGSGMLLTADDLTRGFRIDVWDSHTTAWHTLCARTGTYRFVDANITRSWSDEGIVTMNVTSPTDGSGNDLRLHESLFHWQGWSLVAPRPGNTVGNDSKPSDGGNEVGPDYRMQVEFRAQKGSLPRLRFGAAYQFRIRAVDLAGNSLSFDSATNPAYNLPSSPTPYWRFDPLAPPFVLVREALKPETHPGESFERVVIRSNYDKPYSGPAERHVAPPKSSQLLAEAHGCFDTSAGLDPNAYDLLLSTDKSFNQDAVQPEAQLVLPYLPDPLARGAALIGIDGAMQGWFERIAFAGPWPAAAPFRVSLIEGSGTPSFDSATRVLTIPLRKAEVTRLRLSTYMNATDLALMGVWNWALESPPANFSPEEFNNLALAGQIWMLTPWREIMLIHAVQQPLLEPKFQRLAAQRQLGATFAQLSDECVISGKSTSKVDLMASWEERVDDGLSPPAIANGMAKAFEVPVQAGDDVVVLNGRHEFHDTKYRKVIYQAVATTRFREYFPTSVTDVVDNITRKSPAVSIDVLNAAPPAAPKVLYIVPTFSWNEESDAAWRTRRRKGGGLRIYLDRPWYSSGDGELLGVVLWGCAPQRQDASEAFIPPPGPGFLPLTPQVPNALLPHVTQWGMDPLFDGSPTPTQTTPYFEHFTSAQATETALPLLETSAYTVAVAGHAVAFDPERNLWYSDIDIDMGDAYYPFIRMALARFQPKSVRGAHLSRVVLADFAQLAPDRSASVSFDSVDPSAVTVAVSGISHLEPNPDRQSRVVVDVQTLSTDGAGRKLWIPVAQSNLAFTRTAGVSTVLWAGTVALPSPRGSKPMRLIIKEFERLPADAGDRSDISLETIAERLVYADTIDI